MRTRAGRGARDELDLRVAAARCLDAPAAPIRNPAELFQDLLAVRDAPGDSLDRLGREKERRLRHEFRPLAARIVDALDETVVDGAWWRHDLRAGHARDRHAVPINLRGEALREAF